MNLVLREGAFSSVLAQGPLGPVSEVHGVFSNRDLPPISEGRGQPVATAIDCNVLGVSLTNPGQQLKRRFLMPGVKLFIIDGLWLLENALSTQMRNSHVNYICTFTHRLTGIISL